MLARTAIAVGFLLFATAPVWADDEMTDEEQIRALEQKFADAFEEKDLDGVMSVYHPNVLVYDVVPPRQYVGTEAYRKDWQTYFDSMDGKPTFGIADLTISVDENMAYGTSIQKVSGTDQKGNSFDYAFRVTDVYRKDNTGEWKIVHEHVSLPINLETNTPDPQSKE